MSDEYPSVRNPVDHFANIAEHPRTIRFRRGNKKLRLRTGHFQGTQRLPTTAGNSQYYAMTWNSLSRPFFIIIAFTKSPSRKGKIVAKHRLPSDGRSRPLKHPGGFQLVGDYAVTGVEDDRGKKRSQIWDAELAIKS